MNPFKVIDDLEQAICEYTGAPYAATVNSCTMAILLAVKWCKMLCDASGLGPMAPIVIPKRTYVSVPMSIIHAGGQVCFRDEDWLGEYQLKPLPVWDSARHFTSGMYRIGQIQCVSFHATKILADTQGGAILCNDKGAYEWFKRMRFDGRTQGVAPKCDTFTEVGMHCYMSPDVAARLLHKLSILPYHNEPLPNSDYPDLSTFEVFK